MQFGILDPNGLIGIDLSGACCQHDRGENVLDINGTAHGIFQFQGQIEQSFAHVGIDRDGSPGINRHSGYDSFSIVQCFYLSFWMLLAMTMFLRASVPSGSAAIANSK